MTGENMLEEKLINLRKEQLRRMKELKYPEELIHNLETCLWNLVFETVDDIKLKRWAQTPYRRVALFLPVFPLRYFCLHAQAMILSYKVLIHDTWNIKNSPNLHIPFDPYWTRDIRVISAKGKSIAKIKEILLREAERGRRPMTIEECLALAMHTNILQKYKGIAVFGSESKRNEDFIQVRKWKPPNEPQPITRISWAINNFQGVYEYNVAIPTCLEKGEVKALGCREKFLG